MQTARYTLTPTPIRVDVSPDDSIAFRDLTVIAQEAGTLVACEDAASFATGARIPVTAGQAVTFDRIQGNEAVWLAAAADLDVDVIETGVA